VRGTPSPRLRSPKEGMACVFASHVGFLSQMSVAGQRLLSIDRLTVKIKKVEIWMCRGILSRCSF
jgi:hypothetical protein